MFQKIFMLGLAVLVAGAVSANAQGRGYARGRANGQDRSAPIRFQEMDRNGDRVITRDEWRGSDQSFNVHAWNGDGVLSGNEVGVGAVRTDRGRDSQNFAYSASEDVVDDWTERRFRALDYNRDDRLPAA